MYATARDLMTNSTAVTEEQITSILMASGFGGKILGYNAADHSLLIQNTGVLQAAVATSVQCIITCTPLPGHETQCPQTLPVQVQSQGSSAHTTTAHAVQTLQAGGAKYNITLSGQHT